MAEEEKKEEEVYEQGVPTVLSPPMGSMSEIVDDIRYRAQLIARAQKLESGVSATEACGFVIGFLLAILMVLLPVAYWLVV
ncbi:MAG: tetrahydromethanopterin S-methyltransferase subunit F [Methermicoccaceae archaeon]